MKIDLSTILEMVEEEDKKIKENKAPVQPKQEETTLDLQGLFSLFEELEPTLQEKEEGGLSPVITKDGIVVSKQQVLDLIIPKIVFREKDIAVGQEMMLNLASKLKGDSVLERLRSLANLSEKNVGIKPERRSGDFIYLINKIAATEGLMSVFSGFEGASAGFVNEKVMSSIFPNGKREETTLANKASSVTDFVANNKQYVLKTLREGASSRKSSAFNYVSTLVLQEEITHVDCIKMVENGKFIGFRVDEFTVNKRDLGSMDKVIAKMDKSQDAGFRLWDTSNNTRFAGEEYPLSVLVTLLQEAGDRSPRYRVGVNPNDMPRVLEKDDNKEAVERFLRQFKVDYKPTPIETDEEGQSTDNTVRFDVGLKEMRAQLIEVIQEVMQEIYDLYSSLSSLSSGMGKYFTAKNSAAKNSLRNDLLQSAQKIQPSTRSITSKLEE